MDALLFAKAAREEKDAMLENYLSSTDSMAGEQIAKLKAAGASDELIREVFDSVLTDCFYNILLGIDGQMPIGSLGERSYRLLAPDSTVIANASGTLAEAAYEAFYGEGEEAAEVLGSAIAGIFIILVGIIFVFFGALSLIFFIVYVSYGGTMLGLAKKPIDKIARRVRSIKVGAIFGFIFAAALVIAGIVAAVSAPASIALFLPLAIMTVASSIVNIKMCEAVEHEWSVEAERRREAGEYLI